MGVILGKIVQKQLECVALKKNLDTPELGESSHHRKRDKPESPRVEEMKRNFLDF